MMVRAILMFFYVTTSLAVFFVPNMAHRKLLFGVVVPEGFRASVEGRNAIRDFRIAVAISIAAGLLAIALLGGHSLTAAVAAGPLGTAAVGVVMFIRLNGRLKRFAVPVSPIRQMELAAEPERLPWFVWLGIIPIVLLAATAVYLQAHWDHIPARFPVHFDLNGQPNRWVDRSVRGVFGALVLGGELAVWLFAFALAAWYGTRRSEPIRKPVVLLLVMVECFLGMIFARVALLPLTGSGPSGFSGLLGVFPGLMLLGIGVAYMIRKANEPRSTIDPTPAECWKAGMIYYNPDDAALFVGRRDSFGLTPNLGNPRSWILTVSLLVLIASGFFVLR